MHWSHFAIATEAALVPTRFSDHDIRHRGAGAEAGREVIRM